MRKSALSVSPSLFILAVFLFFRPITVSFDYIGSYSLLDIYGTAISYLILLGLLFNIKRMQIDFTSFLIILFSLYCLAGLALGASYRDTVRMLLPFLLFFLCKTVVVDKKISTWLLEILALGYIVPIFSSISMIMQGTSETVITGSMVERQFGLSSGPHTLAHLMLFFSFSFALYFLLETGKKNFRILMSVLLLGTFFCILNTYTRTVFLGGLFFWFFYLLFWKRKLFFILLIGSLLVSFFLFDEIRSIVTQENAVSKTSEKLDVDTASSGRISIWNHNMQLFLNLPWTTKLTGVGLGNEMKAVPGMIGEKWFASHNDYLSLLVCTGIIGFLLYLSIYGSIFFFLLFSNLPFLLRIFGLAVLFSVMAMNLVSNSYIVRFQMAQLFWFLIGLLYALSAIKESTHSAAHKTQK